MKKYILIVPILLLILHNNFNGQGNLYKIYINEFMASNSRTILDEDFNEYSDWIELYNGGESAINLNGFYLTDNTLNPSMWKIKFDLIVAPKAFVLFWADGKDTLNHTNFNLSKEKEEIALFDYELKAVDEVKYDSMSADISYGRFPDGDLNLFYFDHPTPRSKNLSGSLDVIPKPHFSIQRGFYPMQQTLLLTCEDPTAEIKYTLDGALPTDSSTNFSLPIDLTKTTVVRAFATKQDCIPSEVVTKTYFINEQTTLPVVSIATDPKNFWDDKIGIYVVGTNGVSGYCVNSPRNWNRDWERPISLEFFEDGGTPGFNLDAGMKIGGGCTRKYPEKSLAIYARSDYGTSKIKYNIFKDKPMQSVNNILLRNTGQDWWRTLIRDGLMHTILIGQMDIERQAYRPAIVFLNGEYWGIHDIREKHNEHYLESNFGINPDSVDILVDNADVKNGKADHYKNLISFIKSNDIKQSANYEYVKTQMDVDNYINYQIAEIYYANIDWPGGNIKYWRPQKPGAKWRWILFDTDLGFGAHQQGQYNSNSLENATSPVETYYANPPWSTYLLRTLLSNTDFKNDFVQRFAMYMNTTFKAERLKPIIDSIIAVVAKEVPRHKAMWPESMSFGPTWESQLNIVYEFAEKRSGFVIDHLKNKFGISGTANLAIKNPELNKGKIFVNTVEVKDGNFTGIFFKEIPIHLKVVPNAGYKFTGWSGVTNSTSDSIAVVISGDSEITASFEVETSVQNEIEKYDFKLEQNYPNPFNPVTIINYELGITSNVTLKVFDILGNEIATLVNEEKPAGSYRVDFDASKLSNGIYFYQIKTASFVQTRKMILLK
ncbi:MAG: CotH kinase family protein [Ignavibacteriales bacterium]|nr:CotH kinase family protein [Ignavibacteriales bacterium]